MNKLQDSKFIFVVGIGGSDLASKAVWDAITLHKPDTDKKVFFLESPETREYEEIKNLVESEILNPNEFAFITISKSGKTTETLSAFHKTFDILFAKFGEFVKERALIISTKESSLWQLAEEKGIECLEWEGDVGGRFSAFTVVHTTILKIAGLDTEAFISGGKEMKSKCDSLVSEEEDAESDLDYHLAENIFEAYKNGFNILDFFIFNSELETLGKWCRQLIAESLGAVTPTVSIGPTDLHSMLELYLGGPKNRFTIFIKSVKEIEGGINDSAYENVSKAYKEAGLPFMKYEMEEINEKEIGQFMAFMIATTLELAQLLEVDPYDQPAVERYKKNLNDN